MIRWLVLCLIGLFVSGCASPRDRAVQAMNGVSKFADGAHDTLAGEYKAALDVCLTKDTKPKAIQCGADADVKFEPMWKAYRVVRSTWLSLAVAVHAYDLGGGILGEVEALQLLADLAEAVNGFRSALAKGSQ